MAGGKKFKIAANKYWLILIIELDNMFDICILFNVNPRNGKAYFCINVKYYIKEGLRTSFKWQMEGKSSYALIGNHLVYSWLYFTLNDIKGNYNYN
jgi:hypothetical protein